MNCAHWKDIGLKNAGGCGLGLFGSRPSFGVCMKLCNQRVLLTVDLVEPKSFYEKVKGYVAAEVSGFLAPLGDEEFGQRMEACRGCEALKKSEDPEQVGWCLACGCGFGFRAELTVKGRMPKAECPKKKWPKG